MLLQFYGLECGWCHKMVPFVERLEKEHGIKVEKYEVWHNEENAKKMAEYADGVCAGVPFFFNTETKQAICGAAPYEALVEWAGINNE